MDKYGIIGYPLKHSFSNKYFSEKFAKENIDAQHQNFEIENIGMFPGIIESENQLRGLNVTIPYKEKVIEYLDELDDTARMIGAVNVIKVSKNNQGEVYLKGYNSDLIGFQNSIKPLLNNKIHKKALILGTGGASKAVKCGLMNLGLDIKFVSRTAKEGQLTYNDLSREIINEYKVIVNSSPVGTFPNVTEYPNIPYEYLTKDHILYDLVYNPIVTKFLELGIKQGAKTKNGAEMFELQAKATWEIWNDKM
ncbi:shikimate dehydrogenase [Dysgonomonas sp. OttesenSCG-928-M03]|nr:shikimate dehydrogenase [Dysgonomonas sp. OttesenSCG-928-M03]